MKIMDILVKDAVILDVESKEKPAILEQLAGALAAAEPGVEAGQLLEVLVERESLQSTGIGDGVDFESIDGQKTHLFFLLVVPEHSGGLHLKALARISRFFRDAAFRKALMEAETRDDVVRAIEEEDAKF